MTIKTIPDQKTSGPLFHEIEERISQTVEGWVSESFLTGEILRESKQADLCPGMEPSLGCYQGSLARVNKALLGWAWVCVWSGQVFECLSPCYLDCIIRHTLLGQWSICSYRASWKLQPWLFFSSVLKEKKDNNKKAE